MADWSKMKMDKFNIKEATFEDVENLCRSNPIIHACLLHFFRGEISKEQALIACAVALDKANQELANHLADKLISTPPSMTLVIERDEYQEQRLSWLFDHIRKGIKGGQDYP